MKNYSKIIFALCVICFFSTGKTANAQTTFNYTGGMQTYTVPACATQLTVTVAGAQGGEATGEISFYTPTDAGGEGGTVSGVLNVVGGSTIDIFVGGQGTIGTSSSEGLGGYNGGANGWFFHRNFYDDGFGGGGGGGASDIRIGGVALGNRVVVAGGGGGGGVNTLTNNNYEIGGAGGGLIGGEGYASGVPGTDTAGGGGTQALGGLGGTYPGFCTANSGALGIGGADCSSKKNPGGGGGGGYYGGGGGNWAGGGGGSSYVGGLSIVTSNVQGNRAGNGIVIITPNAGGGSVTLVPSQTNPTCSNNNGVANVVASGGSTPYTYLWSPSGQTTSSATALTAGTYTVTVHDNCGNSATTAVTLISNTPTVTATQASNVLCNGGSNATASTIVSGGITPYTYSWAPSGGNGATGTGLSAGTYTVTVTEHSGCTATASVSITQPAVVTAVMGAPTNVLCNGGTGSATVTAGGGVTPYTYSWAPNGGNGATGTGLTAGTYTVTVKDNNGCSATASVSITQPAAVTAVMGAPTDPACNGGTGSAIVTAGGGVTPYTYSWAPNGGNGATGTGLTAGSYTVTVKDHNGCSATASVSITQPTAVTAVMGAPTDPLCNGGTGSATVTAGGGVTPYTYSWAPNGGNSATGTGLTAGTYTVTVKDNNGCSATASVIITQPAVVTAVMGAPTNILCNGGTGSATVTAGGGTTPYTYSWAPNGGNGATGTGLTAGSYTVTVKDNNGCSATASVSITQPTLLTAVMGAPTDPLCNGGTGSATVTAGGGTTPYTYLWAPNGGNGATGTGLTAGSYTVTVKDNNGCSATASVSITQPAAITAVMGAPTDPTCNGGTGSATVTAGGGVTPYTYSWAPNGGNGPTGTGLTAGTYTVTVKDNNGCSATASVSITQPALVTAIMGAPTDPLCNGGTGSATVTAGGGVTPYTYSWAPNGGNGPTGTGLTVGSYTVTVKDNNGCSATASVTITQPALLTAVISGSTDPACNGGSTGSATVLAGGGTLGYNYSWTPGGETNVTATGLSAGCYTVTVTDTHGCTATATTCLTQPALVTAVMGAPTNILCNGGTGSATVTAGGGVTPYTYSWAPNGGNGPTGTGLTAGTYTVTVKDNNGCSATASVSITQPALVTAIMGAPTDPLCNGGTGSATVTAGGGVTPYTYSWAPSGGNGATGTGLTAGSYTVTVTDNNGCSATASVSITQPTAIGTIMGSTPATCSGSNGTATVTASGGNNPYTYTWNPGGQTNPTATGLSAGNYTVTVKDANGCTATASVAVTEPSTVTAVMGAPTTILCNGGTASATVAAGGGATPYTYSWAPNGGNGATGTGLTAGTYTVTVKDNNGCTATASISITQPAQVTAVMGVPTNVLCHGGTGTATVTAGGGTIPYTYSWAPNGGNGATGTGLTAGSYTVTVTDNNGCSATASITITQPGQLTANMGVPANVLCNGGTGSATVTPGGGTTPYTYSWAPNGGNGATGTGLTAGSYTVTVTDANGCSATASVTITQPTTLGTSASFTPASCNLNNGSATAIPTGGTSPYTYTWNPGGQTNITATSLSAGNYTVTVKDANGCTATASVTVTQPSSVTATMGAPTDPACHGGTGSVTVTAGSGTAPYTYSWAPSGGTNATATGLTAGGYTVTVEDHSGCSATASVTITQPAAISIVKHTVPASSGTTCNGSAWVTVSGGTAPYTYLWTGGNTTDSIFNKCQGSYCCTVTDAHNCTDSVCINIDVSNGIDNVTSGSGDVKVYPNPNNGFFNLEIRNYELGNKNIEVYNVLGEKVYSQFLIPNSSFLINLSTQPNGVYFYLVRKEDGTLLGEGKVMIEK